MKSIQTNKAPAAIGPYSQGIVAGDFLFTSGQAPFDPATGETVPGGIAEQAEQTMKNVLAVAEAAGADASKIVKTTCFLADMDDFAAFNRVYAKYIPSAPARSCVAAKALPRGILCEVEAVIYLK